MSFRLDNSSLHEMTIFTSKEELEQERQVPSPAATSQMGQAQSNSHNDRPRLSPPLRTGPSGITQGVLVTPKSPNTVSQCHDALLSHGKFPLELLKDSAWKDLSLPKQLGLPLRFVEWPTTTPNAEYNHLVQALSIDADISRKPDHLVDAKFGQTALPSINGPVMLVRADQKPLKEKHIEALAVYLETWLTELVEFGGGSWKGMSVDEIRSFAERMRAMLSPQAFVEIWEEYQRVKVEAGKQAWKDTECPV